jgi:hypothetical protein
MTELIAIPLSEYNLVQSDSMNYIRKMFDDEPNYFLKESLINEAILRGLPQNFIDQLKKDIQ